MFLIIVWNTCKMMYVVDHGMRGGKKQNCIYVLQLKVRLKIKLVNEINPKRKVRNIDSHFN